MENLRPRDSGDASSSMYHAVSDMSEDEAVEVVSRHEGQNPDLRLKKDSHDQEVAFIPEPRKKGSFDATKWIIFYAALACIPMLCFSAVLLGILFKTRIETVDSSSNDALALGYYIVDFPAARLIFVSSWSSSVAPRLASIVMGLYLFRTAKVLLQRSSTNEKARLPTPYQLVLLIGLSTGSLGYLWRYMKYGWRSKHKFASLIKSTGGVLVILQLLSLAIFGLDSLLHFTTESVLYMRNSTSGTVQQSFSRGLSSRCTSLDDFYEYPCTYVRAVTGEGLEDSPETTSVFNDMSTQHHLVNFSTPALDGSDASLVFLGPASSSVSNELKYTASTIGVQTSCKPISRLCQLRAPIGAATPFHCSSGFHGDLQTITLNSTATSWKANDEHLVFGADFLDDNFTQPYNNYSSQEDRSDISVSPGHNLPSSWYMAVAVRLDFGVPNSKIPGGPEITIPVHGGAAFILRCQVATYDVTYTSFNGSLSHVSTSLANGSVAWLYNSVIPAPGTPSIMITQGTDIAIIGNSSAEIASEWGTQFSRVAVSILAPVYEARPNLAESTIQSAILTRVPRAPLLGIVVLNIVFAIFGLLFGCMALASNSESVAAVAGGLSIDGLVASIFETGGGMVEGAEIDKCFSENFQDSAARVGLHEEHPGQWDLVKKTQ